LIVENGLYRTMAALVVVSSSAELQIERMLLRDSLGEADARARIQAQSSLEAKLKVADFVIHNDGALSTLQTRVAEVHEQLLVKIGVKQA
jgi:dephospho-CoA kinase